MQDYQIWKMKNEQITLKIDDYGAGFCIDVDGGAEIKNLLKHELDSCKDISTEWNNPSKTAERYEILTIRARFGVSTQAMIKAISDKLSELGFVKM